MKKGIHRIRTKSRRPAHHALAGLELLRNALAHFKSAGACYTAARVRFAISSAKGAVRAAHHRERT